MAKLIASIDVFYFCECSSEAQNRVGPASLDELSKTYSEH
jgi:hypothetical protein